MRFAARRISLAAIAAALTAVLPSHAARIDDSGMGQALVFPYYSAQTALGAPLNTFVSVVNHSATDAKALRVRFREGRLGGTTLGFNLFLGPNDTWTGAVVPSGDGTRLLTADASCTDPAFTASDGGVSYLEFSNAAFASDGAGAGLDRTREGYVEVIEMATLKGTSAAAVTPLMSGLPPDCAAVRGAAALSVAAPGGALSGGETLINVANGMDFTVEALALADLATRPFYRAANDPYPDFNAAEVDAVSVVFANGAIYRSLWSRPVDAVSAVLMRSGFAGEFVVDKATNSMAEFVVAFPTRHYYWTPTGMSAPFQGSPGWASLCEQPAGTDIGNRALPAAFNAQGLPAYSTQFDLPLPRAYFCAEVVPFGVFDRAPAGTVFESAIQGFHSTGNGFNAGSNVVLPPTGFEHGWIDGNFTASAAVPQLTSLPNSTRTDLVSGVTSTGAHSFSGLPLFGFAVRTFTNGALACGSITCQGNYGGAFPLRYRRIISP